MKKLLVTVSAALLLSTSTLAQQAKPSPGTPAASTPASTTRTPELKERAKPETPITNVAPSTVATLPVGTPVRIKLETALSTDSSAAGDAFSGRVLEDVKLNDRVIFPVGATLQGQVVRVSEPHRIKGKPMIQLLPQSVVLPNGQKYSINAVVVDTNRINGTSVDDEGRIKGQGHTDRDVMEVAAGTGVGAIVGGIAAGGKGSLIGAGVGAGATVIHWLTKKNSTSLPAGSEIIFELSRPMVIEPVEMAAN
jgi:hypothetical protein